jgi:hypothetical protein
MSDVEAHVQRSVGSLPKLSRDQTASNQSSYAHSIMHTQVAHRSASKDSTGSMEKEQITRHVSREIAECGDGLLTSTSLHEEEPGNLTANDITDNSHAHYISNCS